jgi:UDP-2,3-diacylglucosamine hydrolase
MIINSFTSISDLHIESEKDDAYQMLLDFLNISMRKEIDAIFLLGDIFDVFAGNHSEYLHKYNLFFQKLDHVLKNGRKIFYFEGNHDFHLGDFFKNNYAKYFEKNFFYVRKSLEVSCGNKKIIFDHGDNIEPGSFSYFIYKKMITSHAMEFITNKYLTFSQIQKIGSRASSSSARYSRVYNQESVREKFRRAAKRACSLEIDAIIMGHSHVEESCTMNLHHRSIEYFNNGYAAGTRKYVIAENDLIQLKTIE